MTLQLFILFNLLLTISVSDAGADSCSEWGDDGNIRLHSFGGNVNEGAIQICHTFTVYRSRRRWYKGFLWIYITPDGWTDTKAQVACRQLGLPHSIAQSFSISLSSWNVKAAHLTECAEYDEHLSECYHYTNEWHGDIAALRCSCPTGLLRLVSGPTSNEGKVETCVNGHWRTVCSHSLELESIASFVCAQLGYSRDNATIMDQSQRDSWPANTYICTLHDNPDALNCSLLQEAQVCTQDFRVMCQTRTYSCAVNASDFTCTPDLTMDSIDSVFINETTTNAPDIPYTSATTNNHHTDKNTADSEVKATPSPSSINSDSVSESSYKVLSTIIGLLTAALVVVTVGWIVSCVYWWRRVNQSKNHTQTTASSPTIHPRLDNPMYDGSIGTHSQTNHTSLGPTYEHVEGDNTTGYDVINRGGAPRPHPPMTLTGLRDPTSEDYSVMEGNHYHLMESVNLTGEGHSEHRRGMRHDPQDYEIPTPTT